MKKIYDMRLTSNNQVDLKGYGFFEKIHFLVYGKKPFNDGDYIYIEGEKAWYRVHKDIRYHPEIVKFLERI